MEQDTTTQIQVKTVMMMTVMIQMMTKLVIYNCTRMVSIIFYGLNISKINIHSSNINIILSYVVNT